MLDNKQIIKEGKAILGIEFGSTRIKAVLINEEKKAIASGDHEWENRLDNGIWTYTLEDIWTGLQSAYANLVKDVKEKYDEDITFLKAMGFSAMMHGYMVFDENDELLVPFRTWRNGITEEASDILTEKFDFNIPQRWSVAHLYQAIISGEDHIKKINYMTTLAGYVHWKLTDKKVLGIGDASGMFPIDSSTLDYDKTMENKFNELLGESNIPYKVRDILPEIMVAGEVAGTLTEKGAKLLDPSGKLQANIKVAPPEGDAGTGMTATNSVAVGCANISAGTSIFGMAVVDKTLKKVHKELDLVTTPSGETVAMAHANNCTSDINAWISLFGEVLDTFDVKYKQQDLFTLLYKKSLEGKPNCGGLLSYGYISGENITNVPEGRPMFVRTAESEFNLSNFMKLHIYSAFGAVKVGLDILTKEEGIKIKSVLGHGGIFKTEGVAQKYLAAALNAPVSVMETAGEGGPWGMALLALYMVEKEKEETLNDFLENKVFKNSNKTIVDPCENEVKGYESFIEKYKEGLPIELEAIKHYK